MPIVVSNPGQARAPGFYVIPIAQPNQINGITGGRLGIAGQNDWGPDAREEGAYVPDSGADLLSTFYPAGSSRTTTLWLAMTNRVPTPWTIARVLPTNALRATCTASGVYGNVDAVARFKGTLPNTKMTLTVAAAGGGDSTKRKVTITLSDSRTGTTIETYDNLAAGDTPVVAGIRSDGSKSYLLWSLSVWSGLTSWPTSGTYAFSGGSNGSAITSSDYDVAIGALDAKPDIIEFGADDCGDAIRPAVNGYLVIHEQNKTERFACLSYNQADGAATIFGSGSSGVGSFRDKGARMFGWVKTRGIDGNEYLTPHWTFAATADAALKPNQSAAWRSIDLAKFYAGISSVPINTTGNSFDWTDETIIGNATDNGVAIPYRTSQGVYTILHDRTTSLAINERFHTTQKQIRYVDLSIIQAAEPYQNGPLSGDQKRAFKAAVDAFLYADAVDVAQQNAVRRADASTVRKYPQWGVGDPMFRTDIDSVNDIDKEQRGEFYIRLDMVCFSTLEKGFLLRNIGTAPTIS